MSSDLLHDHPETPFWKRSLAGLLTAWCLLSPTGLVWAGPVADATAIASQRPSVGATAAGTPLVNITAPNAAGLSYNRYQRFDVDSTGAILNNSLVSGGNAMGIQIGANPNFAGKSATVIVNEVVTALPSQLSGPLAIFGDKARIIVANPNGIACDGCSFINTSGVALTTGQVRFLNAPGGSASAFDNASALSFVVNGGQIVITGSGLSSPLARLDLIAQTLKLEAPSSIGSGSLNLIAGRNTVDAETLAILAQGSGNDAATQGGTLAIDASLLGAMNAGKILIVSTASGLGVRSAPNLAASSGDLRIAANGDVTLARADAAGNLNIASTGTLVHQGLSAQGNAALSAAVLNNLNQSIVARGNVQLVAPVLDNRGGQILAGGGLDISAPGGSLNLSDGTLYGTSGLTVAARDISNSGNFSHGPSVTLVADNSVSNTGSFLVGGDLNMRAGGTLSNSGTLGSFGAFKAALGNLLNQGTLQSDGLLDIRAVNLDNQHGAQLVGGGNSRISLSGVLNNAGSLASTGSLEISADSMNHTGRTETQGDLQLSIAGSASNSGQMLAAAKLDGSFGRLVNSGTLQAGTDARFNLGAASDNSGGQLLAIQDLSLTTTHSGDLGGSIGANRDVTLNFGTYTHNGTTTFMSGRDLTVNATEFTNNAVMESWQNLSFNVTGTLANTGQMLAGQDITLKAGTLINTSGFVEATRDLNIQADTLINKRPPVTTEYTNWGGSPPAESVNCRSDHGYCESWKQVEAGPAAVLWAGRNLTANVTGTLSNDASLIAAVGQVSITADTLSNTSRTLSTTWHGHWKEWKGSLWGYKDHDDYGVTVTGNTSADINAGTSLAINAPNQTSSGNLSGNTVVLAGTHLTNGLTDPKLQTPASTVPAAEVSLGVPGVNGKTLPASVQFNPTGASYFTTTSRLAMLVPGLDINSLLPDNLRNTASPFLMDAWLEQQAIRQAALSETGRASFLAMNDPAAERAVLLQAGARFAQANGIRLGVALTTEQIAKLDSPILWYVTENFTGPDGKSYSALVPKVYLPDSSRMSLANVAGGTIQGGNVSLTGETVRNTGFIVADAKLSIATQNLINEKRSADVNNGGQAMRIYEGTKGYWKITGTTVQPGGFISAAELDLNAKAINSISGEFIEKNQDVGVKLAAALGTGFTLKEAKDDIHQDYKQLSKPNALGQVVMVVVIAVAAYYLGPYVSQLVGSGASAGSTMVAASTTTTAGVTTTVGAGLGNVMVSGALTSMATSAASQLLTTGKVDAGQMFRAGVTSGLTAGLLNAPIINTASGAQSLSQYAGIQDVAATGSRLASFNFDSLGQNLVGIVGRGVVTAGVDSAINGSSFGTAFKQSLVSDLAALGANAIGQSWGSGKNPVMQTVAHAGLGATAAALTGKDATAGAIGGAAESILGNLMDFKRDPQTGEYSRDTQIAYTAGAMALGGAIAVAAGRDGVTAANAAQNAAQNNRLLEKRQLSRIETLSGNNPKLKALYVAAGCAIEKCSAEYTKDSANYKYWKAIEDLGNRQELAGLKVELQQQTERGLFGGTKKMFDSTLSDSVQDVKALAGNWLGETASNYKSGIVNAASGATEAISNLYISTTRHTTPENIENATTAGQTNPAVGQAIKDLDKLVTSGTSLLGYGFDATLAKDLLFLATTASGSTLAGIVAKSEVKVGAKGEIVAAEVADQVPGRVQSRINVANGRTATTPLRDNGNPVSAGFDHVLEGHFDVPISNSRSVFSVTADELKNILQSDKVLTSPVTALGDGQFVRTVDVGRVIGTTSLKEGGAATSVLKVFTDRAGNLITTFPVKGGK